MHSQVATYSNTLHRWFRLLQTEAVLLPVHKDPDLSESAVLTPGTGC